MERETKNESTFINKLVELCQRIETLEDQSEALQERLAMLSGLLNQSETWRSPEGTYRHIALSLEHITGYGQEDFFKNPFLLEEIAHPEDREKVSKYLKGMCAQTRAFHLIFRIIRKDGEQRWISHYSRPVYGTDRSWQGLRSTERDITALKHAEQEREAQDTLRQKNHEKGKLLNGLLPICASCKKIRDTGGYWHQLEKYIRDHSEAEFSHGLCPECVNKLYPEFSKTRQ
ncbi:MAG: PAS domain-containing protein [Pseudomonadota bacterium]